MLRIVHYVNHFFGQLRGEGQENAPPCRKDGPVGPGRAFAAEIADWGVVAGTVICGDMHMVQNAAPALEETLALIRELEPDALIAGPAFNAGRYGLACGAVCEAVRERLGIPVITGMHPENPGADLYAEAVPIVGTEVSIAGMRDAVAAMASILRSLAEGTPLSEGQMRLLLAAGPSPAGPFTPAPPLADLKTATIALATEGGLVPAGNPDQLETFAASRYYRYPLRGAASMAPGAYQSVHGGIDRKTANALPLRILPLDALRDAVRDGVIGGMADYFFSTTGNGTSRKHSGEFGRGMARELWEDAIRGVILTAT